MKMSKTLEKRIKRNLKFNYSLHYGKLNGLVTIIHQAGTLDCDTDEVISDILKRAIMKARQHAFEEFKILLEAESIVGENNAK